MKPNRPAGNDRSDGCEATEYYVLGGGHVGAAVARRLLEDGHTVTLVDESCDSFEIPGIEADLTDVRALEEAGVADASTVVVATESDRRNLLVAQLVRTRFDVPRVVVLANLPDRLDPLSEAGHETVCATTALSDTLVEEI